MQLQPAKANKLYQFAGRDGDLNVQFLLSMFLLHSCFVRTPRQIHEIDERIEKR